MRLKLFRAASMPEAMAQIRKELGPEALILSTRRIAGGIELTAGLEPEDEAPAAPPPEQDPDPAGTLAWHGVPGPIADRLVVGPLETALASILTFAPLPGLPDGPPLLLAGPPGAGKTLTTARLATRLVLAGSAPVVITADGRRAGAPEELAAYTRLLGITLVVASNPGTLARALAQRPDGAPVLIDTAGVNPWDEAQTGALAALSGTAQACPVLILPAGQDALEAAEIGASFADLGIRHLLPTRLDLARRLGSVIAAAVAGGMALSEAGTGPGATDGLSPLTPAVLAARLRQRAAPIARQAPIHG